MEFLKKVKEGDYPTDYLLTRLQDKKGIFNKRPDGSRHRFNCRALWERGDIWESLLRDYQWVYDQMNKRLHEIFSPFPLC